MPLIFIPENIWSLAPRLRNGCLNRLSYSCPPTTTPQVEQKFTLIRQGLAEKVESSRKQIKEAKNRGKKTRGTGVRQAKHKAKRSQDS